MKYGTLSDDDIRLWQEVNAQRDEETRNSLLNNFKGPRCYEYTLVNDYSGKEVTETYFFNEEDFKNCVNKYTTGSYGWTLTKIKPIV
jgi:hypothetical protein